MHVHLVGDWLRDHTANKILKSHMRECYYDGQEVKILSLTKPNITQNFAFLALTTKEAWNNLLTNRLNFYNEKLKVNILKDKDTGIHLSKLRISTTLVANNLPQQESQSTMSKTLKCIFGVGQHSCNQLQHNKKHLEERKPIGVIHSAKLAMYMEWLHKSTYMFGLHPTQKEHGWRNPQSNRYLLSTNA